MIFKLYNILSRAIVIAVTLLAGVKAVAQVPAANFSASPLAGCSPLVVNFQNLTTGTVTAWAWNFGNGNTSTLQNPTATYFTPGTYTVTLTATNASGSNTMTKSAYITVYEPPTVNFSASTLSGCYPLRVQFTDMTSAGAGNNIVSWDWDFGNGNTSSLQNPQAVYNTAGSFSVTLKVTNDKGCVRTISRPNYITVGTGVDAGFTSSTPTVCRAPATVSFTNTSTGPGTLSYFWAFGDGNTSVQQNPTHTFTSNGTFNVMLVTSSSAGCIDTVYNPLVIGGLNTVVNATDTACMNSPVTFLNGSTPAPLSATWSFGDGGTASTLNAIYTYTSPGTYDVWLHNNYGACSDSVMHRIYISPKPPVNFTAPVRSKCQPPLTVNFQDLTPNSVAWSWDFGDGGTSNLQNPSHTYTSYGYFTVKLTVTNSSGCVDSVIQTNFVTIQRPVISINNIPTRGCIPYPFTFNPNIVSVDPISSYEWDFGDGGTSTASNPTHTYTALGTYDVRLIVTTTTGCRDTLLVTEAVKVGTKPVADFTAQPIPVCGRQPVYFTDFSAPADEWLWDFGDGNSSSVQNPTHSYEDTGYFNVTLIAFNNGCGDTLTKTAYTRVLPPVAKFNWVANCSDRLEFTFRDLSIAPQSWSWDFGDGNTSTVPNPVHRFPTLGAYNVKLTVTNGSCIDSLVLVVNAMDQNPDFSANILSGCKPAPFTFTASNVSSALTVKYYWDFGDGVIDSSSSPSISHTYNNSGNYTVTLITRDVNGCTDTIIKTNYVRVNGPVADFSAINPSGCVGMTTTFTDLTATDGVNAVTNWQWDFGDGTIQNFTTPPFQHTYNSLDTFSVKLIVTDAAGCIDSTKRINIIMTTDPTPDFSVNYPESCPGATIRFDNNSVPFPATSFWDFGDGNTSTSNAISTFHAYNAPGFYTVKLIIIDSFGCADSLIKSNYVSVVNPLASFTMSDSIGSCIPLQVDFTNTSSNYTWSLWDFGPGEGTSSLTNPTHYYATPGNYQVKLVVSHRAGCLDSTYGNILVFDTAGADMNYMPIGGCRPLPVTLDAFSPGPVSNYLWDLGDGTIINTPTPSVSHIYMSYGNFLPKLIMEDPAGCQIPIQGLDTVYVIGADAKFGLDRSVFCDSGTVQFIDSTTWNDQVLSYNWDFGDGNTSTLVAPSHTYTSPGLYPVSLMISTVSACLDTAYFYNVKVVQSPLIGISGDSMVCVNTPATHQGYFIIPDTSQVNWTWTFPNGNSSGSQTPSPQIYPSAGTYDIISSATNSTGCVGTDTMAIIVNPLPVANMPGQMTVQVGFPVLIPATYSPNTNSWAWTPGTGLSCSDCPTPEAGPKFNTIYQVQFTDDNGCSNTASIEVIVICKNANVFIPNTFSPNGDGSNDVFYPRGKGLHRVKLLRVFNRWGEIVFENREFPINDPNAGWNGNYKGKKAQADVYVYQAELYCDNGDIIRVNGNIALIL